jgi:hypothetical protein
VLRRRLVALVTPAAKARVNAAFTSGVNTLVSLLF